MKRAALLLAICLVGCGGAVARHPRARPVSSIAIAEAHHEYPPPVVPRQRATGASGSPSGAVAGFAGSYINWTADTVATDMSRLAGRSIGQARAVAQLAAAQTAADPELHRNGIANDGTVEAVVPLPGHRDEYLVVTRERTTATGTSAYQGLLPAWHVTLATVTELARGAWVVSGWQPQS